MHKNRQAVTLIETLISLTIVGVALVALMPVVTVRKASTVSNFGNLYWTTGNFNAVGNRQQYYCPRVNNDRISIGAGNTQPFKPAGGNSFNFTIYNQGLGNRGNFPLQVTNRLTFNDATIKNSTINTLHIASEPDNNSVNYYNNLYIAANTFVLEQNTIAVPPSLQLDNDDNFTVNKNYGANENIISNLSTIRLEGNEYMHVSQHNINGNPSQTKVIGIGRNAVKGYTKPADIIVIANVLDDTANNPNDNFNSSCGGANTRSFSGDDISACKNPDLVIGAKPPNTTPGQYTAYYNAARDWIIYHSATHGGFTINAPIVEFPSINVGKVILPSDKRLKNVADKYNKGVSELLRVKPVEFTYKNDKNKEHHIGVTAQELRKVFPEAVEVNSATGYLMVGTDPVFYALINGVKEFNAKNQELKKKNDELEEKIAKLRKIRDDLKASQGGAK